MIIIPVLSFFGIEIILGYLMFYIFDGMTEGEKINIFLSTRLISLLIVLILTNGLLTYFVAKSIIKPIQQLSMAAKEIAGGNLDFSVEVKGSDEISQLASSFETMRKNLKETEAININYENNRKELIASISHDLKTPITSIKGYVNGIRDGVANTPEKMDKYMVTISRKADELDHLIDELFMYSKLDLNKVPYHLERLDLHAYLDDYVEELRFDLQGKGALIRFHVDEQEDYLVKADREKLNRVIANIIVNSLKYMDKKTQELDVFLSTTPQFIQIQIKDNGSGINTHALPHIFDQFYRTDASRNSSTGGSGIGLAIVKRIIEDHGGKVWAESEEGIGTSIYVTLPKVGEES